MNDTEAEKPAPYAGEGAFGAMKVLVEEHPVAMLAGGILLGALVAGALSRPGKAVQAKTAENSKPRPSFGGRVVELAALGAELAAAYAAGVGSAAEEATESAAEAAKPQARRISGLAGTALRTLGPMLSRLGRKPPV
jgi:hypothetical protein